MGRAIDIKQNEYESFIHDHDRDISMIKVRCNDLSDSDRGVLLTHIIYYWIFICFYFHNNLMFVGFK